MSVHTDTESDGTRQSAAADRDAPRSISKDDAFHILQNARRRAVLRYLLDHEDRDQLVMRDLAEEVAAWEHDTTVAQLTSDERQRVYIALYQSHLPKLDDHGVIRYNQSRGVIETTDLIAVFAPYVEDGLRAERDLTVADDADVAPDGSDAADASDDLERGNLSSAVSSLFGE